jgi:hypothetical protein
VLGSARHQGNRSAGIPSVLTAGEAPVQDLAKRAPDEDLGTSRQAAAAAVARASAERSGVNGQQKKRRVELKRVPETRTELLYIDLHGRGRVDQAWMLLCFCVLGSGRGVSVSV